MAHDHEPIKKRSVMEEVMCGLGEAIDQQEQLLAELCDKLSPVMETATPNIEVEQKDKPDLPKLPAAIREYREKVVSLKDKTAEIVRLLVL